jgi:hypothetical protein
MYKLPTIGNDNGFDQCWKGQHDLHRTKLAIYKSTNLQPYADGMVPAIEGQHALPSTKLAINKVQTSSHTLLVWSQL